MSKSISPVILLVALAIIIFSNILTGCTSEHEVNLKVNPEEAAQLSGGGTYREGEEAAVEVKPEEGYRLAVWQKDGEEFSAGESFEFTVEEDVELRAMLEKKEYEISLEIEDADSEDLGEVSGEGSYQHGRTVTLKAEPKEHFRFAGWKDQEGEVVSTEEVWEFTAEEDQKLTATFETKVTVEDNTRETDWDVSEAEIVIAAEQLFQIYPGRTAQGFMIPSDKLTEELYRDIKRGKYISTGLGNVLSGIKDHGDDYRVHLERVTKEDDYIEVAASVEYPHIEREDHPELKAEIEEKIKEEFSEEDNPDPRSAFADVLAKKELSREETGKTLQMEKVEGEPLITYLDPPDEILASFDELYRKAFADRVEEVVVKAEQQIEEATVSYAGQEFSLTEHPGTGRLLDSHYLMNQTRIKLVPHELELSLEEVWEPLEQKQYHNLQRAYGYEEFLSRMHFKEALEHDKVMVYFNFDIPPGGESHSVLGYMDLETQDFNFFRHSQFALRSFVEHAWSSQEDAFAYLGQWVDIGIYHLDIYDARADEVITIIRGEPENLGGRMSVVEGADEVVKIIPDELPDELKEKYSSEELESKLEEKSFINIEWSDDGSRLYFELAETESTEDPGEGDINYEKAEDTEVISFAFDVTERRLINP